MCFEPPEKIENTRALTSEYTGKEREETLSDAAAEWLRPCVFCFARVREKTVTEREWFGQAGLKRRARHGDVCMRHHGGNVVGG